MVQAFYLGDIVQTKKQHPCGSDQWEVIRLGADIKIRCTGCNRLVMLTRVDFQKRVKKKVFENKPEEQD